MPKKDQQATSRDLELQAFRATGNTVSLDQVSDDILEFVPQNATGVRLYEGNHWIVRMEPHGSGNGDFNWRLMLEADEHDTMRDGTTLADLEEILFGWAEETGEGYDAATIQDRNFHAPLAAFRASVRKLSAEDFEKERSGAIGRIRNRVKAVLAYPEGLWIAAIGEPVGESGRFSEYAISRDNRPGEVIYSASLENLEQILFETMDLDEESKRETFNDSGKALRKKRREDLAGVMMATRPELIAADLTTWLDTHHARLSPKERAAARAIIDLQAEE